MSQTCVSGTGTGSCQGSCAPGQTECGTGANSNTAYSCAAGGAWGNPIVCTTSSTTCIGGLCSGQCAPGQTTCSGDTPQTCSAGDLYERGDVRATEPRLLGWLMHLPRDSLQRHLHAAHDDHELRSLRERAVASRTPRPSAATGPTARTRAAPASPTATRRRRTPEGARATRRQPRRKGPSAVVAARAARRSTTTASAGTTTIARRSARTT